jgi:hypothetical protein
VHLRAAVKKVVRSGLNRNFGGSPAAVHRMIHAVPSNERRQDRLYLINLIRSRGYQLIIVCLPLSGGL